MDIRPFRADDGMLIKQVRLRSLADAPYAFGVQSFEEEAALPDSHWHQLAAQVGGQAPEWRDRGGRCVVVGGAQKSRPVGEGSPDRQSGFERRLAAGLHESAATHRGGS